MASLTALRSSRMVWKVTLRTAFPTLPTLPPGSLCAQCRGLATHRRGSIPSSRSRKADLSAFRPVKFRKLASASALRIRDSELYKGRTSLQRLRAVASRRVNDAAFRVGSSVRQRSTKAASAGKSRMRDLWNKYGAVLIGTYFCIWLPTFSSFFIAAEYGVLSPKLMAVYANDVSDAGYAAVDTAVDTMQDAIGMEGGAAAAAAKVVVAQEEKDDEHTFSKYLDYLDKYESMRPLVDKIRVNPTLMNVGVAFVLTKITEPFRMMITIAMVPRVARILGRRGR
eukprot:CAMPEP_0194284058 /NCGR_PEP_ID=MMETSP0169-20130528/26625_1 /TAXON_ID=218684 /ORGANISM="Corethron pennatum, Strain L29A3" /LENGTH=281 /DNA_ID=CAMNT_0039029781 /DNA_START=32 /DNA_END=877 /DNA_ORIENTATION=+